MLHTVVHKRKSNHYGLFSSTETDTRDWLGPLAYYASQKIPKRTATSEFGTWDNVVDNKNKNKFGKFVLSVVDGRTHLEGGKEAWKFEKHGFMVIPRPAPAYIFSQHKDANRKEVDRDFGPKVCEAVRKATGAKRAFWMSHQRRAEAAVRTVVEGYATGGTHRYCNSICVQLSVLYD